MRGVILVVLLMVPWAGTAAQRPPVALVPGDYVRVWRPWPFDYWEEGVVLAAVGDTLVMERAGYHTRLVLPLPSVEKLEVRRGRDLLRRSWEAVPLQRPGTPTPMARVSRPRFWLTAGFGHGTVGMEHALGLSYQIGRHVVSIRAAVEQEAIVWDWEQYWEEEGDVALPFERSWDVGMLYGRAVTYKRVWAAFSTGATLAGGIRRGAYLSHRLHRGDVHERRVVRAIGLPVEVQVVKAVTNPVSPNANLGVGICWYADLNTEAPFTSLSLLLQLGRHP